MNSQRYEELCRFVIADRLKIDINQIRSATLSSPVFPGLQAYDHQVDLYWETDNELVQYLNIANAKWRRTTLPIHRMQTRSDQCRIGTRSRFCE